MGYSTDFNGEFKLNKKLTEEDHKFLFKLSQTRRMARNVDPKYGVEGEFYVDGSDYDGTVVDLNRPPSTQPSLWCQWTPTDDGMRIQWDYGEKFYHYIEWLQYLIEKILKPRGYILSGEVSWQGESSGDVGIISVENNVISVREGYISFKEPVKVNGAAEDTRLFFVVDGPMVGDNGQNEELFETLEGAEQYAASSIVKPRIRICIVRNAYKEENGDWNYDDLSDTFETIKTLGGNDV